MPSSVRADLLQLFLRSGPLYRGYRRFQKLPLLGGPVQLLIRKIFPTALRRWRRVRACSETFWFSINPRFDACFETGRHEPRIQKLLCEQLQRGQCFYDVGAHLGFFTVLAARRVGPQGLVLAFEPDRDNGRLLQAHLDKNSIHNVEIIHKATWSSSGSLWFQAADSHSNRTSGRVFPFSDQSGLAAVPCLALDELAAAQPPPDLIKIDVEGAEWEVLQGAAGLLARRRPKIICEVHCPHDWPKIVSFLRGFDYQVEGLEESMGRRHLWACPLDS